MKVPTKGRVLALLRNGTPGERMAFLKGLPPNGFTDSAAALMGSDNPGMVVVALSAVITQYCYGGHPEVGAVLAAAAHERAVEIWETVPNHGLLPTTLSGFANSHVKALSLLGRSKEVLKAMDGYIPFYEKLGEHENLPSLKVLRIEALINLKRLDDADAALQEKTLLQHPIFGIEAMRLQGWVDRYRSDATRLKSEQTPARPPPSSQDLLDMLRTVSGLGFEGEAGENLKQVLNRGELFLTKGDEGSELAVRGKVRNASSIFVHGTPAVSVIQRSLADLESSLTWAKENKVTELENDALWGIYLCNGRLKRPSQAADALIQLRDNLELMRLGIKNPLKRGGIFGTYPYLFNALCEQLQKAGRSEDLLEAIESSKGRVIADRLTAQTGDVVKDSAIYGCVMHLPELAHRERFHYLTYFVDESCVYGSLVSKEGVIYAIEPVHIQSHELRDAAACVSPKLWAEPSVNVSTRLSPLVAWFDRLLEQGIVAKGDHIYYSPGGDIYNIPLHYLRFRDGILIDWFSVSRVHSAFHLERVLKSKASVGFDCFAGFVVPLRQDLDKPNGDAFLANLDAPLKWLKDHGLSGEPVRLSEATLKRVTEEHLDHRIVHFSTHCSFPGQWENPTHNSFLLLADKDGLPDSESVIRGDHKGKLTPTAILDSELNVEGSHISIMAPASGLAREGIGGDMLGLDWAFIQAGAASLISTHWNISAACGARFFTLFYEKWLADKQPLASAFRATMLELLDGDYTPNSLQKWTAFSLTGLGFESKPGEPRSDPTKADDLGLHLPREVAPASSPQPAEARWLNAAIRDHDKNESLHPGESYVLEFGVDDKAWGNASAVILPPTSVLFDPDEEFIELTIQLRRRHFEVAQNVLILKLPRVGPSKGKARFDIIPQQAEQGTLTAIVHNQGKFLLPMEVTYSIGTEAVEPPTTLAHSPTIGAVDSLRQRKLCLVIKPGPARGYECMVLTDNSAKRVLLPITEAELGDAIKTARDGLMKVVSQRDEASRLVFQTGLDIDAASGRMALHTLARAGARLFQRIFSGPLADCNVEQVADLLRTWAMNSNERLTLRIVPERFPIPWGLLYLGAVGAGATLSWDQFLGMRLVIEQILLTNANGADSVIQSDRPSLAVSINVNVSIDKQMNTDLVGRQLKFWQDGVTMLGPRLQLAQRQSRADFLGALTGMPVVTNHGSIGPR